MTPLDRQTTVTRETGPAWGVAAVAVVYATLRYHVFGTVPWSDWPVFVLNKALAMTSLLACLAWVWSARRGATGRQAVLATLGARAAVAHVVCSLALLGPTYYPAFFGGDRLSWPGSVSLLVGVATMVILQTGGGGAREPRAVMRWMGWAAFAAGLHAACYGYPGWMTPSAWPGYLPPITLLSFAAGCAALVLALSHRPERVGASQTQGG